MEEFKQKEEITAEREKSSAMAAAEAQVVKDESKAKTQMQIDDNKNKNEMEKIAFQTNEDLKIIDREAYWKEELLEKQINSDAPVRSGISMPKVQQNPGGAIERHASVKEDV